MPPFLFGAFGLRAPQFYTVAPNIAAGAWLAQRRNRPESLSKQTFEPRLRVARRWHERCKPIPSRTDGQLVR